MTTFARVVTAQLKPATLTDGIRAMNDQVAPHLRQQPGFKSWELLVDHTTSQIAAISRFATEAEAQAGGSHGLRDRTAMVESFLVGPARLEIYEVATRS